MGKKCVARSYVFRRGYPRVTETLQRHYTSRDTGYMGTGVYAYGSKAAAVGKEKSPVFGRVFWVEEPKDKTVYEVDVTGIKFLFPMDVIPKGFISSGYSVIKYMSGYMNAAAVAGVLGEEKWMGKPLERFIVFAEASAEDFGIGKVDVRVSIAKSVAEGKKEGLSGASQPINHLLIKNGYGGIDPGDPLRDDTSVGVVIFRETLGIDAGEGKNVVPIPSMFRRVES